MALYFSLPGLMSLLLPVTAWARHRGVPARHLHERAAGNGQVRPEVVADVILGLEKAGTIQTFTAVTDEQRKRGSS